MLDQDQIRVYGYPGRPAREPTTENFYTSASTNYDEIREIITHKKRVADTVAGVLMGVSQLSAHAEDLFEKAFKKLDFAVHDRDVSEFKGNSSVGVGTKGKEPPNVDFVVERDKIVYGVDIKNWIRYEAESRDEIAHKVTVALALHTKPWIVARYIDRDTIYTKIIKAGGLAYPYVTLLFPTELSSLADEAKKVLGYPTLSTNELPDLMVASIEKRHKVILDRKK